MPGRPRTGARRVLAAVAVAVALLGTACADNAPQDTLEPAGPAARTIDNLQNPMFLAAGIVFLIVEGLIVFIVIRFRQRKGHEDDVPVQLHGNTKLEIGWTIVPALLLGVFAVATVATIFDLNQKPKDAVEVSVFGQQWWWEYRYPEQDGVDSTIITANELVIPVGRPVYLSMTSRDVIHSFWIPKLNGKRDVVPGRTHHLTIEADKPGRYSGQCTEFCGLSHANMRAIAVALSPSDFQEWLQDQQRDARPPRGEEAQTGLDTFRQFCTSCHQINGVQEVPKAAQVSGAAPNLTHLFSRQVFAGAIFPLNRPQLEAWLRNPPGRKPMAPDEDRGMPDLGLTEEQIDQLLAYLETLE
jgi:cytochrome c oxidase subunit II